MQEQKVRQAEREEEWYSDRKEEDVEGQMYPGWLYGYRQKGSDASAYSAISDCSKLRPSALSYPCRGIERIFPSELPLVLRLQAVGGMVGQRYCRLTVAVIDGIASFGDSSRQSRVFADLRGLESDRLSPPVYC